MEKLLMKPWPWYVAGPMIALVMGILILLDKNLGMSANLRTVCTLCGADKKATFFDFNWKAQKWNLFVIIGAAFGGFIASHFLSAADGVQVSEQTVQSLNQLGFTSAGDTYMPTELFGDTGFAGIPTILILAIGGMLIGFGARYAGGCTSGHVISGLSNLQLPSLVAVIGFFIGGLFMVHVLFPLIF